MFEVPTNCFIASFVKVSIFEDYISGILSSYMVVSDNYEWKDTIQNYVLRIKLGNTINVLKIPNILPFIVVFPKFSLNDS